MLTLHRCTLQPRQEVPTSGHRHGHHEFHLVVQGEGVFHAGSRSLRLQPAAAWHTPPGQLHRLSPSAGARVLQYVAWADLDRALAGELRHRWPAATVRRCGAGDESLFWNVQAGLRRGTPHARAAAAALFASWLHGQLDRDESVAEQEPEALRRMLAFLAGQPARCPALAEVARAGGISPAHAVRLFSARFGLPPIAWHRHARLERASRWLAGSDLPVAEVGRLVGYADQLHFSRAFRAHAGESPLAWRSRHQPQVQDTTRSRAKPS